MLKLYAKNDSLRLLLTESCTHYYACWFNTKFKIPGWYKNYNTYNQGEAGKNREEDALYSTCEAAFEDKKIYLIPYYAWANRNSGEMMVWLNR